MTLYHAQQLGGFIAILIAPIVVAFIVWQLTRKSTNE